MSGSNAQIGWKSEVTPGTAVTPDIFQPFLAESLARQQDKLVSQTLNNRRLPSTSKDGTRTIGGSWSDELPNTDIATFWHHAIGSVNTTGAGPYTHTFTPGDLSGKSLTIQVGKPDASGVVRPFTYAGCKVASWSISVSTGGLAQLTAEFVGMSETTATALEVASYDAAWEPFSFVEASITIDAVAQAAVKSFTITGNNAIENRHRVGDADPKEPLANGPGSVTGTAVVDFDGLDLYDIYTASSEVALVAAFDNGTDTFTITANIEASGATPAVAGHSLLEQSFPFVCLSSTDDATAFTAVLVNGEASAA